MNHTGCLRSFLRTVMKGYHRSKIWEIPRECCELAIVPVYMKDDRSSCGNHRQIILVKISSKMLGGIVFRRLSSTRGRWMCENQAGFPPDRSWTGHIFTFRQITEDMYILRGFTIFALLDLKVAFDSVGSAVLWYCLVHTAKSTFNYIRQRNLPPFLSHPPTRGRK